MNNPNQLITPKQEKIIKTKQNFLYGAGCIYELTKWIIVLIIFVLMIHFFVATIFIVDGESMEPNFHTGQYIIVNRFRYIFQEPKRGDVVVLKFPGDPEHKKYIKRIIALPGENIIIQDGSVFINSQLLTENYLPQNIETFPNLNRTLGEKDYFLMGDNRPNSNDSRVWGVAERRYLIGNAWFILYPKTHWGIIEQTQY